MAQQTSQIVVKENNRTFTVVVPRGSGADSVRIDNGNCPSHHCRCDYAIRVSPDNPICFVFVELKGNDACHAARQILCTVRDQKNLYAAYPHRQAWIIAKGFPPILTTQLQKFKVEMMKEPYAFDLKWKTKSFEINLVDEYKSEFQKPDKRKKRP